MTTTTRMHAVQVFRTARGTEDRLCHKGALAWTPSQFSSAMPAINIDSSVTYQKIQGFGGSFTEAAAFALSKISPDKRDEVLRAYFDREHGLGYTLCRTHINSCDFALGNYAYADVEGDINLNHFDVSRDNELLAPLIKDALHVSGGNIKILASPWSPPAWMKTNGDMNHGGQLRPEYAKTWALYYAKYIQAYAGHGVPIWAVSVQNEPEAVQVWDSCIWSAEQERDFVRDHLGPTLAAQGLGHVKILIWDHNKDVIVRRAKGVLEDAAAARYVWGIAFHWYSGDHFQNLDAVHRLYPDKKLLFTEGCPEDGVQLGAWDTGERYGHEIIGDLNNWAVGFIDWNLALDERGGPNHVGNFCDAPIIADAHADRLHYQSAYYYIGHFSKFIAPGAVRIGCRCDHPGIEATAFRNADGSTVVVVMNRGEQSVPITLAKTEGAPSSAETTSLPHSIMTLVF